MKSGRIKLGSKFKHFSSKIRLGLLLQFFLFAEANASRLVHHHNEQYESKMTIIAQT